MKNQLIECDCCTKEIASNAWHCPYCGAKTKYGKTQTRIIVLALVFFFIVLPFAFYFRFFDAISSAL